MTEAIEFDGVSAVPLQGDDEIVERVRQLVRAAIRRQVWLMFLDSGGRQLPLIIPTEVPPSPGEEDAPRVAGFVRELAGDLPAGTVIVTYERVASDQLSEPDRVWLRTLREACELSGVAYSGPHLCHRRGVRAVAEHEYAA
jgi:hypothetical protein